ncbi:hypothetical protein [Devosia sp.]|uniref:hypothetical protein n=1 Tax=Devosia sp. TaxID=1871048 RepID=UPI002736239B|nr:hypothetical protein [Devosia sp.]MDP2779844.1 hypothetical protein [Devosia sp.]
MSTPVNSVRVWWSIGQIATRDGVSKPAVSKAVAKLVRDHDLPVRRDGRSRVESVSVAHYDHLRAEYSSSEQSVIPPVVTEQPGSSNESRDEALRQEAWLRLGRAQLDHQKEAGQLVRVDKLIEALGVAGRTIQNEINRLANKADDIALAVSKEGTSGARIALRTIATEINTAVAAALEKIAAAAPEHDAASEADPD